MQPQLQNPELDETYRKLYKNHGQSIGYWEGWVEGNGLVVTRHARTLNGKAVERSYRAKPKNLGRSNETTPYEQGIKELDSKAEKKRDKGYVDDLDAAHAPATNRLGHALPMKCLEFPDLDTTQTDWTNAFIQPKLDGHRAMYKDGVLYSSGGKEFDLPHIVNHIKKVGLDPFHLDGELYVHGVELQDIARLIKHKDPQQRARVQYWIYDQVDTDTTFVERFLEIAGINQMEQALESIVFTETRFVTTLEACLHQHREFRRQGYEGSVLRLKDGGYVPGKRPNTMYKLKEFYDAEFTIIDVLEGKPTQKGPVTYRTPVWRCITESGQEFNVLCQGTMTEKDRYWHNRHQAIGKALTVQFHYLSNEGVPQLPVALRFREDF